MAALGTNMPFVPGRNSTWVLPRWASSFREVLLYLSKSRQWLVGGLCGEIWSSEGHLCFLAYRLTSLASSWRTDLVREDGMSRQSRVLDSSSASPGTASCDMAPSKKLELDWNYRVLGQWMDFGVYLFQLFLLTDDKLPWQASCDSTLLVAKSGFEFRS